jgi:methylmalonyl-CoA mutase cobalamin-binding domain/chain
MTVAATPTTRRARRSVVVMVGDLRTSDAGARALSRSLQGVGIDTVYLGRAGGASEIAASATELGADAVEVCVAGGGAVAVLRELLRELRRLGRPDVGIIVHRIH